MRKRKTGVEESAREEREGERGIGCMCSPGKSVLRIQKCYEIKASNGFVAILRGVDTSSRANLLVSYLCARKQTHALFTCSQAHSHRTVLHSSIVDAQLTEEIVTPAPEAAATCQSASVTVAKSQSKCWNT